MRIRNSITNINESDKNILLKPNLYFARDRLHYFFSILKKSSLILHKSLIADRLQMKKIQPQSLIPTKNDKLDYRYHERLSERSKRERWLVDLIEIIKPMFVEFQNKKKPKSNIEGDEDWRPCVKSSRYSDCRIAIAGLELF